MNEAGIGRAETLPHRERLSDEQLGNLISAVGNHEAKALTLLLMEHDRVYSEQELFNRFINMQGGRVGWRPNKRLPFDYCRLSLSPIGLVAKEELEPDLHTYGYGITEYGERIGIPLAGLLLDFSEKHPEISLLRVFGSTNSSSQSKNVQTPEGEIEYKNRAPILRLKIFWELVTRNLPIRTTDLVNAMGGKDKALIGRHLAKLADSGIISYESSKSDQPFSFYTLSSKRPTEEPKQYVYDLSLTKQVYNFFLNQDPPKQVTLEEITDSLMQTNPQMDKLNKKGLRSYISNICSYLTKRHYLERGKFKYDLHSEITLAEQQKSTLLEFVTLIGRFQKQDSEILKEGQRKAMEIINNPQRASDLLKKAKEASPNANRLSIGERSNDVLSFIQDHPGSTNTDLFNTQNRKPKLSKSNLQKITRFLEQSNRVTASKEKKAKHFTAVDIKETQAFE